MEFYLIENQPDLLHRIIKKHIRLLLQHCPVLLVSLHPVLASTYCKIEIRAHKPRLHALIVMEDYNPFSCALYIIHVFLASENSLRWVCTLRLLYTERKCNFMTIKLFSLALALSNLKKG